MFPALNPYLLLAAGIAVAGAYFYGRHDGAKLEEARHQAAELAAVDARQTALEAAAKEIAKITVTHTTIQGKVKEITREVPIYRDCHADTAGVRLVNQALANGKAQPTGDRKLPGTDGNGR